MLAQHLWQASRCSSRTLHIFLVESTARPSSSSTYIRSKLTCVRDIYWTTRPGGFDAFLVKLRHLRQVRQALQGLDGVPATPQKQRRLGRTGNPRWDAKKVTPPGGEVCVCQYPSVRSATVQLGPSGAQAGQLRKKGVLDDSHG